MKITRLIPYSLLFLLLLGCRGGGHVPVTVTILHWNDFHSQNVPYRVVNGEGDTLVVGGMAELAGYVEHFRGQAPRPLALDAGDEFQGTPISGLTHGASQVELLNIIKPDAYTVGNHEFDYGVDNLLKVFDKADFPVLLGNVVREDNGKRLFPADTILTVDGVRIGVIGVVTDRLMGVTSSKATEGIEVTPSWKTVEKSLKRLTPITDIQIVLSHLGVKGDVSLAERFGPEIELIVGGHSHTVLREPKIVNGVPIVQAGSKGRYLGIVTLEVDTAANRVMKSSGRLVEIVEGGFPPDEKVAEVVKRQEALISKEYDKQVAILKTPWKRNYNEESNIGDWVADCFRDFGGADIGFVNSGGLRKDVAAGPLTMRNLYEVSPFDNELVRFKMTGAELMEYVDRIAQRKARMMQTSGLNYHIVKGKVVSATVNGKPIIPGKEYGIVTIDYVTDHQKKYFGLPEGTIKVTPMGITGREVLIEAAKQQKVISSRVEGRIRIEE